MLTRRRVLLAVSLVFVAALAWSVWLAVRTAQDLRDAQASVERLQDAVTTQDTDARATAMANLQQSATSARSHTDGMWWSALTKVPFYGDDAAGVRALSASLDLVASEALPPLSTTLDDLDSVVEAGRIDVDVIEGIGGDVTSASSSVSAAADLVEAQDSSGFAGALRTRYNDYTDTVSGLADDLASAETAVEVLPSMLGADEPRKYLLIFENNAEIRATGGLPGSWALIETDDGKLDMTLQGSANDFDSYDEPIGDITPAEKEIFGAEMGRFFQDPNFTPDFPRAAEVFNAFWKKKYPDEPLDGVISIDVVGLSYLLDGLGPVQVGDLTLTSDNVVDELLSRVYVEPDPAKQDKIFRTVARTIFESAIGGPQDPIAVVKGVSRAAREGRFHVAPFNAGEIQALVGTRVAAELSGNDGSTPHVDIALNDATGSKMSYYLRYNTNIESLSCDSGVQHLQATITLSQTIGPAEAATLPPYVTGLQSVGADAGEQVVRVHVFAPYDGSIGSIKIDGKTGRTPEVTRTRGRPTVTLSLLLDSPDDVVVNVEMASGPQQERSGVLAYTPSVVPGRTSQSFASAC